MSLIRRHDGPKPRRTPPAGMVDAHMHMVAAGHPAATGAPPLPPDPPGVCEYRQVMARLGIEAAVIVQGNAHGTDNANLLACLGAMEGAARGVAAIRPDAPQAELDALHAAGVRGLRIMGLPGGATGLEHLAALDARAAAMGWTLCVQFDGSTILDRMTVLHRLESRWILDHHGKFLGGAAPGSLEVSAVLSLIDRGNCWFKFCAPYESSLTGGPDYADVAAVSQEIAAYAPERLIWGSNWPHNMIRRTEEYPDDAALFDLAWDWAGAEKARRRMFVDNPRRLFDFPSV